MITEGILIAAITAFATVTSAYFTFRTSVSKAMKDVSEVKAKVVSVEKEVKNSHNTNLRDDIDKTHSLVEEVRLTLGDLKDEVAGNRHATREHGKALSAYKDQNEQDHLLIFRRVAELANRVNGPSLILEPDQTKLTKEKEG